MEKAKEIGKIVGIAAIILACVVAITLCITILFVPDESTNVKATDTNTLVIVEMTDDYTIYADKDTHVMYLKSTRSDSAFTTMLDGNGNPRFWEDDIKTKENK